MKKAAKGKLLDCFNNRRRDYKKAGIIVTTRRSPSIESTSESSLLSYQNTEGTTSNSYSFLKKYKIKIKCIFF